MGALGEIHHALHSLEQLVQRADSYKTSLKQSMTLPPSEATIQTLVDVGRSLRAAPSSVSLGKPKHPLLRELYVSSQQRMRNYLPVVMGLQPVYLQALETFVSLLVTDFYRWAKSVITHHHHREPLNTAARQYHALATGLDFEEHHSSLFHPPIVAYTHCIDELALLEKSVSPDTSLHHLTDCYHAIILKHKIPGADYFDHPEKMFIWERPCAPPNNNPIETYAPILSPTLSHSLSAAVEALGVPPSARYLPLVHILRGDFGRGGFERLPDVLVSVGRPKNGEEKRFMRELCGALEGTTEQRLLEAYR